jgi:hypothetical protein
MRTSTKTAEPAEPSAFCDTSQRPDEQFRFFGLFRKAGRVHGDGVFARSNLRKFVVPVRIGYSAGVEADRLVVEHDLRTHHDRTGWVDDRATQ